MKYRDRLSSEFRQINADIRRTPPLVFVLISCLALILAATITFGGLHL